MEEIYPSYFHNFHCIAAACPDSCCQQWDVEIDPVTAEAYTSLSGPLGDRIRRYLYREDGCQYMGLDERKRCPMWQENGLCAIQLHLGHQALSQVCQQFPRITQDYGTFLEWGLEMSCPEAARMMLTSRNWSLISQESPGGDKPDYDADIMALLREKRPDFFEILKDSGYTVPQRLILLLFMGYHLQGQMDCGDAVPFDMESALKEAREFSGGGNFHLVIEFFSGLEVMTDRWRKILSSPIGNPIWREDLCQLAEYGIYRYFYQTVSDLDLICRIKFIIIYCITAAYLGTDFFGRRLDVIQCFSKEIENDSSNMDAILDGAYTSPAFTDANLLGLLLK